MYQTAKLSITPKVACSELPQCEVAALFLFETLGHHIESSRNRLGNIVKEW